MEGAQSRAFPRPPSAPVLPGWPFPWTSAPGSLQLSGNDQRETLGPPFHHSLLWKNPHFFFVVQLRLSWNFPRGTFSQKLRKPKKAQRYEEKKKTPYPPMPLEGRFPLWPERRPKLGEESWWDLFSSLNPEQGPCSQTLLFGAFRVFPCWSPLPPGPPLKPCLRLGLGEGVFRGHISKGLGRTFIGDPFQMDPRITE